MKPVNAKDLTRAERAALLAGLRTFLPPKQQQPARQQQREQRAA